MTLSDPLLYAQAANEAAEWFVTMQSEHVSDSDRVAFSDWLSRSPVHVSEYLQLTGIWRDLGVTPAVASRAQGSGVAELIDLARRDIRDGQVVPIGLASSPAPAAYAPAGSAATFAARAALVAGVVVAVTLGSWFAIDRYRHGERYATGTGEQSNFPLADGSTIRLNTQSEVRVRLTAAGRDIELVRGEAIFEVAKDASRPFRVRTGTAVVRAVGTVFDVYRQSDHSTVTVIEGEVRVETATAGGTGSVAATPGTAGGTDVRARQQARVSFQGAVSEVAAVSTDRVTAWTQRRLVFSGDTLAAVAAEFNRYNSRHLTVEGDLARLQISAVFNATDPGSLVEFLRRTEHVEVRDSPGGVQILSRPAAPRT